MPCNLMQLVRSAESELEKITQYLPAETERLNHVLEDLTARLRQVQNERTDAVARLESLQAKHARDCSNMEKEKLSLQEADDHSHRQVRKLVIELQESKDETVKLTAQLVNLQHEHKKLIEASSKASIQHSHDLSSQAEKYESQIADITSKLTETAGNHSKVCQEMHQLLAVQRNSAEKWSQESKSIQLHYEARLTDAQDTITRFTQRATELETSLEKFEAGKREALAALAQEKASSYAFHSFMLTLL